MIPPYDRPSQLPPAPATTRPSPRHGNRGNAALSLAAPPATSPNEHICPRCDCLDVPTYEAELRICPHCAAVFSVDPPEDEPSWNWLDQWPLEQRGGIGQRFYAAARQGHATPEAVVEAVALALRRALDWTTSFPKRELLSQILNDIADNPKGAKTYAETVLAREQLPRPEREAIKREQARVFVHAAMVGKDPTPKQLWLLRNKGYSGEIPADRARASELIEALLHGRQEL